MPHFVILWTDALLFLLLFVAISFGWHVSQREHLRAPWREVGHSKVAMGTLVILAFYVLIGLLDSIHYHPQLPDSEEVSPEIISLFDDLVEPLRTKQEKTYSAPLAHVSFAKENIEQPDGSLVRTYPRLLHGGAHLEDPERDKSDDIIQRVLRGLLEGLLAWILLVTAIVLIAKGRPGDSLPTRAGRLLTGKTTLPWHAALHTLLIMSLLGFVAANLSGGYHLFGTDKVGQDVFYQTLKSIRTGLMIGTLTTLVMLPAAILLGIMAGYFRGWVDDLIQYLYTTLNAIPGVLLIAAAVLLVQVHIELNAAEYTNITERADIRLLALCLILGITSWTGLCRLLRGETFKLREMEYVQASQAFGVGQFTILRRHILPNVMHIVMIAVVLDFSGLVLAEAVLAYVNIGVDPSTNSWGNMINAARLELAREPVVWWSLSAAFLFMFTLVLAANLFADVVRDAFDPRLRRTR